jgi:diguanylate cyclase (GGDEF)-like protein/PAS domain S-box-containing protein
MSPDAGFHDISQRLQREQAAIFALLKSGITTADPPTAFRALTECAARTLGVQRVSIWLLDDQQSRLVLHDLFVLEMGRHGAGMELDAERFPAYFHALRWSRSIVADDARTDPRTVEFAEPYLRENRIASMLDSGIWLAGKARGVVCLESVGAMRRWTPDEQQFAGSIADLAAATLEHETLKRAHEELGESRELYEAAVHSSPDWISIVRMSDSRILHVNREFERASGYRADEVVGRTPLELGLWADPAQRSAWLERMAGRRTARDFPARFRMRSGEVRNYVLSAEQVEIRGEKCVIATARDVTDEVKMEDLVYEIAQGAGAETGESFFRSLVGHLEHSLGADLAFVGEIDSASPERIRTIAAQGQGREVAPFSYDLHGSPCETIIGRGLCAYPQDVWKRFPLDRALAEKGIEAYVGAPLIDSRGAPLGLIAVLFRRPLANPALAENLLRIFAARASAELERGYHLRELRHQALHDPLTDLPNRELLRKRIDEDVAAGPSESVPGVLLLIDLDRFKEINDTLGHHTGDVLLRKVAGRLQAEMKSCCEGLVARLGGDEFAIWVARLSQGSPDEVASHARAALTAAFEVEGYRLEIGASIGVAIAPRHASTASELLRCADVAMYAAKRDGLGFAVYDSRQDPYSAERLALLSELGSAIRGNQMVVHYQPRAGLSDDVVNGFEALVRWQHPQLGLLSPARFIPLAELSDVIRPLTLWVLDHALAQQRAWREAGMDTAVSVNLSARHLVDDACPEQIARLLATHATDAQRLELEITESALIADPERASSMLRRIRALGVQIAIDDFGTGYSSLSHLKRLPLHALKIDMSFVRHMLSGAEDRAIVESTISLAHNLGLKVVAEGIEDEATLAALRACGCDEGQGFHIGRPMSAEEATRWLGSRLAARPPAR